MNTSPKILAARPACIVGLLFCHLALGAAEAPPNGNFFQSLKQAFKQDLEREVVRGHFDMGTPPDTHRYYCMVDPKTGKRETSGVAGQPFVRPDGMTGIKAGAVSFYDCASAEQQGTLVTAGYLLTAAAAAAAATPAAAPAPAPAGAALPPPAPHGAGGFVSATPVRRIDYWQRREADIASALSEPSRLAAVKLLFLGDSITDFWLLRDSPWVKGQKFGRTIWDESFGGAPAENLALNLGISGDRLEHLLYRLLPRSSGGWGELDATALNPEFIVLMVGINNTSAAEDPVIDSVVAGVRAVLVAAHDRKPKTRIVLQSLLPTDDASKNAAVVRPINERLDKLTAEPTFSAYTVFLDLYPAFVDAAGKQISGDFNDGLHPNEAGYRVWRDRLVPWLQNIRASHAL